MTTPTRRAALLATTLGALTLGGAGCATVRSDFARADGTPLGVFDQTRSYLYDVDVKTGSVKNALGQEVLATYQRETRLGTERVWFGTQGGHKVDEESFYRIVGDRHAVETYDAWHQSGASQNFAGLVVGSVGAGIAVIGLSLLIGGYTTGTEVPIAGGATLRQANTDLVTAGGIVAPIGGVVTAVGFTLAILGKKRAEAKDARLIGDPERMKNLARRYNERTQAAESDD